MFVQNPMIVLLLLASLAGAIGAEVKPKEVISAAPAPATLPPAHVTGYLLGPNDMIEIKVYQEDDLTFRGRIGADGTINMPLLGKILLNGQTMESARLFIEQTLGKDYLVSPQVSLAILEHARRKFSISGKVAQPRAYDIPGDEKVTIVDAIVMAGGFSESAKKRSVIVIRTVNGKKERHELDVQRMMTDIRVKSFEILPGDSILVEEAAF